MIRAQLSEDREEIESILKDQVIWKQISTDYSAPYEEFTIRTMNQDEVLYLMLYFNKTPIGLMMYHRKSPHECGCHFQVLPAYRKKYSRIAGKVALNWFWRHMPKQYIKLTAEIPSPLQYMINFAHRMGFVTEGVNKRSYIYNGEICDITYLGLSRPKI